jgi:two-component system, chemotaxis family, CheB/CheR fusion protein
MSTERVDEQATSDPAPASSVEPALTPSPDERQDFHIVGIGASAGGLDSLERLFTHLPTDTGMAFVSCSTSRRTSRA